jgi:hypothetical protein
VWLTFFLLLPATAKADWVDDLKADVTEMLPTGTHVDKVRQFLIVRKFKITELPKQKGIAGRLVTKRDSGASSSLVVTFQFDDAHLLQSVSYQVGNAGQ